MAKFNRRLLRFAKHALPLALLVPAAFGISAMLEKMAPEKAEAALEQPAPPPVSWRRDADTSATRVALVIGNSDYPDANTPLRQPTADAQSLADALRRSGFEVDMQQNLGKAEMKRAVERFKEKLRPGSVGLISYGGLGIQTGRQSYMIPVDAQIWKEADVVRDGISFESILSDMHRQGADVKIAILDASRRNPFERRFRAASAGLAAVDTPQGTLLLSATAPGKVAYDGNSEHSLLIGELLKEINASTATAETVFNRTRIGVSRVSNGEQVPLVASSLIEGFSFYAAEGRPTGRVSQGIEVPRREYVEADADDRATDVAPLPPPAPRVEDKKPQTTAVATKPAQYELASRPADKVVEKPVENLAAEKPVVKAAEKPVEKVSDKPAVKDAKRAKEAEESKPRRRLDDVSRELTEEQPRAFMRRSERNERNEWYQTMQAERRMQMRMEGQERMQMRMEAQQRAAFMHGIRF